MGSETKPTRRRRWSLAGVGIVASAAAAAAVWDVSRQALAPDEVAAPAQLEPQRSRPLAAVTLEDPGLNVDGLEIEVTAVERIARDIVEVRLAVANLDRTRTAVLGSRFAETAAEEGALSAAFLTNDAGTARYFVLRDQAGKPACSTDLERLGPGARRAAWVRFVAPGREETGVTLHMKGIPPLTGLLLPAAP